MKYQIIVMSFDGDFKREKSEFNSIDDAWNYANDLGSKWFFYPFCFVVSKNTIRDAVNVLEWTKNRRIKTISQIFGITSKKPETQGMTSEEFMFVV